MPTFSQQGRQMAITTALGADVLLLQAFRAEEAISRPFRIDVDLLSTNGAIDFDAVVGKRATIAVEAPGGKRYFNGVVSRFSQGSGGSTELSSYSAEIVPWTWLLTLNANCRIFQNLTVPDILKQVLKGGDVKFDLRATYPTREFCVQYRETDFNFVSRLMEQYGIYYYYQHADGKHTMVLADSADAHPPCPGQPRVRWQRTQGVGTALEADVVGSWNRTVEVRPGKYTHTDYNFETPSVNLRVSVDGIHPPLTGQRHEIYDYPGEYTKKGDGEMLVRLRIEEEEALHQTARGRSGARNFTAGHRFDLTEHSRSSENRGHVLLSVDHEGVENGYLSDDGAFEYSNAFACIPTGVPYRPPRQTPRPSIQSCQTAQVVGPPGEEIYCDKYGRVKVQFHWDREGKRNESSSCWIRVSHPWAGKGYGAMAIPRIEQEVVVSFLEGDPDQPLITGRVYNGEQMPAETLPAGQNISGFKSNSTKGGGGYNELSMDDTKGQELITLHGQFDMESTIEHDESMTVGNSRVKSVGKDETVAIGNNRTKTVEKNESISVGENRSTSVGKNEAIDIGESRTKSIGKKENVSVGEDRQHQIGKNDSLDVGKNLLINVGDQTTIKTGDASLTMKKDGTVIIKGKDITFEGSGKITGKASGDVVLKGAKVTQN